MMTLFKKIVFLALVFCLTGETQAQGPGAGGPFPFEEEAVVLSTHLKRAASLACAMETPAGKTRLKGVVAHCAALAAEKENPPPSGTPPPIGTLLSSKVFTPPPPPGSLPPPGTPLEGTPPTPGSPPPPPASLKFQFESHFNTSHVPGKSLLTNAVMGNFSTDRNSQPEVAFLHFEKPVPPPGPPALARKGLELISEFRTNSPSLTHNLQSVPGMSLAHLYSYNPGVNSFSRTFITRDCNEDGVSDAIVALVSNPSPSPPAPPIPAKAYIATFIGRGDGQFFEPRIVSFPLPDGTQFGQVALEFADMDGDDVSDSLFMGTKPNGVTQLYVGTGNNNGFCATEFSGSPAYVSQAGDVGQAMQVMDMDDDGDNDVALLMRARGSIWILPNEGEAEFEVGAELDGLAMTAHTFRAAHLNQDNVPDFVVAEGDGAQVALSAPDMTWNSWEALDTGNLTEVTDVAVADVDACNGQDILALGHNVTGDSSVFLYPARSHPSDIEVDEDELVGQVGRPLSMRVSAEMGPNSHAYMWRQLSGPDKALILNMGAPEAQVIAKTPGTYRFMATVTQKPNETLYGPNSLFCPGVPAFREITVEMGEASSEETQDLSVFASPTQYLRPGIKATLYCGLPSKDEKYVKSCLIEQVSGQEIDFRCAEDIPACVSEDDIPEPSDDPDDNLLTYEVTAVDQNGDAVEETTTITLIIADADEAPEEITAVIKTVSESVVSGTDRYDLEGECETENESAEISTLWYAADPADLDLEDQTAASTNYAKHLEGETTLAFICTATDLVTGTTQISEPAFTTIAGTSDLETDGAEGTDADSDVSGSSAVEGTSCQLKGSGPVNVFVILILLAGVLPMAGMRKGKNV